MSAAAYKKEKKLIEEKVQKIRQFVSPTTSRNQIEMALHTHDLDVERTIQAFLEDGVEGALGDWENTNTAKSKSKKKNTAAKANSTTSSTVDSTTTSTTGNLKQHNGKSTSSSNGYNGYEVPPPLVSAASSSNTKPKQTSKTASSTNGNEKTNGKQVNKGGKAESGEESITRCFKEIRQILAEREKQLLSAMRESNARFTYDRKFVDSLANFGSLVSSNGTTALPPTPLMNSVPSHSNEIKHATSHSSLVSSVGEDSGFGQISPVAHEKNVAKVESSGITMQSNAISADQLAEIQRQLAEQLKAAGIDPNVLANASSTSAPPRRRQEKPNGNNKKQQNGGGNKKKSPIELSILN